MPESISQQAEQALELLLDILARLLLAFKEYRLGSCGFVDVLLDCLLKVAYEEPLTMLRRDWLKLLDLPEAQLDRLQRMYRRRKNRLYLRPNGMRSHHSVRALRLL